VYKPLDPESWQVKKDFDGYQQQQRRQRDEQDALSAAAAAGNGGGFDPPGSWVQDSVLKAQLTIAQVRHFL
jgi:hypothetical protein